MSETGKLVSSIVLFSAQVIVAGFLLGIGFKLADKMISKFSRKSS